MIVLALTTTLFCYLKLSVAQNYCALSCNTKLHTACERLPFNCGPGPKCGIPASPVPLNPSEYVDIHNKYRNKVALGDETRGVDGGQPGAANMVAVSYDEDLAYVAQCWSNNCEFKHDSCRRTEEYSSVGQNIGLYRTTASTANVTRVLNVLISTWYNEVRNYEFQRFFRSTTNGRVISHYTQMVWAKTVEVGCGMTKYKRDQWYTYLLVCNYGPAGNIVGGAVYKVGSEPNCPQNKAVHEDYSGLCEA